MPLTPAGLAQSRYPWEGSVTMTRTFSSRHPLGVSSHKDERHCPFSLATAAVYPQSETTQGRISSGAWGSSARGQPPIWLGHLPSLSMFLILTWEGRTVISHLEDKCSERLPVL